MATIKFSLSKKVESISGKTEVLVRFFHGKIDQRAKTNIFVIPSYWKADKECNMIPRLRVMDKDSKQLLSDLNGQNTQLSDLKERIQESFMKYGAGKMTLPSGWLQSIIDGSLTEPEVKELTIFDAMDNYIGYSTIGRSRKLHFSAIKRSLQRFAIWNNIEPLTFDIFNTDILRSFVEYLSTEWRYVDENEVSKAEFKRFALILKEVPESRNPSKRGFNSIIEIECRLRAFFNWSIEQGYITSTPFNGYKVMAPVYGTPFYLTKEERDQVYNYDLSNRPELAVQRDVFIFQTLIGCRVSDLTRLTKQSINNGFIEFIAKKTSDKKGETLRVPLNAMALEIVERYNDIPGDKLFPFISDQKYNIDIKKILKMAGIDRLVTILNPTTRQEEHRPLYEVASSHMARRTFIGNIYKKVKDPNLIGSLTGHVNGSKAFARYRHIDDDIKSELVKILD